MYSNKYNKQIALLLIVCILIPFFKLNTIKAQAADSIPMIWDEAHTLNNELKLQNVETQYKDEEALFYWDAEENGTYTLNYNLYDYNEIQVKFVKTNDTMDVYYKAYMTTSAVVNVTESEATDYAEVNYNSTPLNYQLQETSPNIVDDGGEKAILFADIEKYQLFPGATFYINGKTIKFKWENDKIYFLTEGIRAGNITPFRLQYFPAAGLPSPVYEKRILTKLEAFDSTPTYYNPATSLRVIDQNSSEIAGSKPGIDLTFKHPKVWDSSTNTFKYEDSDPTLEIPELDSLDVSFYLEEYSGLDNAVTQFQTKLDSNSGVVTGDLITNIPDNAGKQYTYDPITHTYTVKLVKESAIAATDPTYIQWDKLQGSRIYETEVYFTPKIIDTDGDSTNGNIEFSKYIPNGGYSYTYLEYILKRESTDEAYLEVIPYQGISNDVLNYEVFISRQLSYLDDNNEMPTELWLTYTHEVGNDPYSSNLFIPVIFDEVGYYYKIKIHFDGQQTDRKLFTQLLQYKSTPGEIVPPPIPKINSISDVKVLPADTGSVFDEPSKINFDIEWNSPDKDVLEELLNDGELYYELLINEEPQNSGSNSFEILKVFRVFKDVDTKIKVIEQSGSSTGTDEPWNDFYFGYNELDSSFRVNDVILKDDTGWATIFTSSNDLDIENGMYSITDTLNEYSGIKNLPNVNFLRMRAVYVRDVLGVKEGSYSDLSVAKSLTLSNTEVDVPIVSNLDYENILTGDNSIRFELSWDISDVSNFEEFMLKPIGENIDEVAYEVYISQDKDKVKSPNSSNYTDEANFDYSIDASSSIPTLNMNGSIDKLRNNDLIAIKVLGDKTESKGSEKIYLEGLDSNQVYYITILTRVKVKDDDIRTSVPSEILSVTTLNFGQPIDENIMPIAPENFEVKEVMSSSTVKLGWTINMDPVKDGETIGYELIKVQDRQLTDSFSNTTPVETIIESSSKIYGYRIMDTDGTGYKFYQYNESTKAWDEVVGKLEVNSGQVTIIDDGVMPNTIYYYYLRAVRVEKGAANPVNASNAASNWTSITYTSDQLEAPKNVTQDFSTYTYNKYEEAVIYFDVAIPDDSTITFVPEIHMYSADDRDYDDEYREADDYTQLDKTTNGAPTGYVRYYYEIGDLQPGRSYSVKVRVGTDETNPIYSPFSKRVVIRTEFDEDNYLRQELLEEYLNYYDLKVQELYKNLYWTMESSEEDFVVKFKEYYFSEEIMSLPNNQYLFDVQGYENVVIYLPNDIIDVLDDENVKFNIMTDGMSLTINPGTLSKGKIEEFRDYIKEIEQNVDIKDYYVKIILNVKDYSNLVNGTDPLSDIMKVKIDVVGSNDYELNLEEQIYTKLDTLIASYRITLENDLIQELIKDVVDEEKLLNIVDEDVNKLNSTHQSYINTLIKNATNKSYTSLYKLNSPMTLEINTRNSAAVALYRRNGSYWTKENTNNNGNTTYSEINTLGEFIFAGYKTEDIIDSTVKNSKLINDVIIKYNLTDFYTLAQLSDLKQSNTKYSLVYSISRILGAPDDVDAVNWLIAEGFTDISSKNLYNSISKQDAFNLLVQAYAHKADIDLITVRINNRFAIEDISTANPRYADTLLKGVDLEVIKLKDGKINPNEFITIEEVLDTFIRIEYRNW